MLKEGPVVHEVPNLEATNRIHPSDQWIEKQYKQQIIGMFTNVNIISFVVVIYGYINIYVCKYVCINIYIY